MQGIVDVMTTGCGSDCLVMMSDDGDDGGQRAMGGEGEMMLVSTLAVFFTIVSDSCALLVGRESASTALGAGCVDVFVSSCCNRHVWLALAILTYFKNVDQIVEMSERRLQNFEL